MLEDPRYVTYGGRRMLRVAGGETPPAPANPPADPPANPPADPPANPPADPPGDPSRRLTQAEVDRIVEDRLARERAKYSDYGDLKTKAESFDALEEQGKTDLERAQEAQRSAEEQAKTASERASTIARRSAIIAEAAKANAIDPEEVVALLPTDSVTVDDDGQVTGAEQAVKSLLERKQHLVGERRPGPGDGGPRTPAPSPSRDDEIAQAEKDGDIPKSIRLKQLKAAEQAG